MKVRELRLKPVLFSLGGVDITGYGASKALAALAAGWLLARDLYRQGPLPNRMRGIARALWTFLAHKWYWDELYNLLFERTTYALANFSWRWLDRATIDGLVNGLAGGVDDASEDIRPVESGYVRAYALSLFAGVVLIVILAVAQH